MALATACLLLNAALLPAIAPRTPEGQPDVLVLINPLEQSREEFRALLADAAGYKLGSLGLVARVVSASLSEAVAPQPKALASGASAALVCRYKVQGQELAVTLAWYDAHAGAAAAGAWAKGRLDLNLDGVILKAFDEVLDKVRDRVTALAARHANAPLEPVAVSPGLTLPAGSGAVQSRDVRQPPAATPRRLLLSTAFAPFLPTGAAFSYFRLGYLPSLLASFSLDTPVGPLGLGAYVGLNYFTSKGTEISADNFVVPLGVDLRYELHGAFLRPFFHVSGGPAVLVMVTGAEQTAVDVLPFLKSGIGFEVDVVPWLGISALVDYDVYFEMPYLVTGFSPSLGMVWRP